jgi:hypothetical protein
MFASNIGGRWSRWVGLLHRSMITIIKGSWILGMLSLWITLTMTMVMASKEDPIICPAMTFASQDRYDHSSLECDEFTKVTFADWIAYWIPDVRNKTVIQLFLRFLHLLCNCDQLLD